MDFCLLGLDGLDFEFQWGLGWCGERGSGVVVIGLFLLWVCWVFGGVSWLRHGDQLLWWRHGDCGAMVVAG